MSQLTFLESMNNKKIGIVLLVLTFTIGFILITLMNNLRGEATALGCFDNKDCIRIESTLNVTHVAFGVMGALFALALYMMFFSSGEEAIFRKLEEDKQNDIRKEKFDIIMSVLDPYEKKVIAAIKDQDGITQNTLRLKTDISKAKLSYVLQELEKRNLIKRVEKGKTLAVYLKDI